MATEKNVETAEKAPKTMPINARIPKELFDQVDDYRWKIGANDPSRRFTVSELVADALSEYMAAHQ